MSNKIVYILLTSLFCLISCSPKELNKKELYAYLQDEDNGLLQKKTKGPFSVSILYKPFSFYSNEKSTENLCFILNISYNDKEILSAFSSSKSKFSNLVKILSFGMKDYIKLETDQKVEIELSDFVHSRHYGMGSGSQILLIFNKLNVFEQTKQKFTINLKEIEGKLGNTKFTFNMNNILKCPSLKK